MGFYLPVIFQYYKKHITAMAKKINNAYETADGRLFRSEDEAIEHESKMDNRADKITWLNFSAACSIPNVTAERMYNKFGSLQKIIDVLQELKDGISGN